MNAQKPDRVCSQCRTLVSQIDATCGECGSAQPDAGWHHLRDAMDPFLGLLLGGRYLLNKSLGKGSSGSVYRARSLALPREFAVKIIDLDGQDPAARMRLEREVEAVGRLRNPHIVPFYEVEIIDETHVGLVMDLVEGFTLKELVNQFGALPLRRALGIARQIANGLHEAHTQGLVHRDLKPENIMVELLPAGGDFVRLLDFGIVWTQGSTKVTRGFIGTPLYSSPEQARGEDVDERSDIYSLGAVLFFILTGRPPFSGSNVFSVLNDHVNTEPPSLSEISEDTLFPAEIEVFIQSLLAKNPDKRPQDLGELIRELDILTGSDANLSASSSLEHTTDSVAWFADEPSSLEPVPSSVVEATKQFRKAVLCERQQGIATIDSMNLLRLENSEREIAFEYPLPEPAGGVWLGEDSVLVAFDGGTIVDIAFDASPEVVYQLPRPHVPTCIAADSSRRVTIVGTQQGWLFVGRDPMSPRWDAFDFGAEVNAVAVSRLGDHIAVGTREGLFVAHTSAPKSPIWKYELSNINHLSFSNDGYVLAVLVGQNTILLENALSRNMLMEINARGSSVRHIRFSTDNQLLVLLNTSDGLKKMLAEDLQVPVR